MPDALPLAAAVPGRHLSKRHDREPPCCGARRPLSHRARQRAHHPDRHTRYQPGRRKSSGRATANGWCTALGSWPGLRRLNKWRIGDSTTTAIETGRFDQYMPTLSPDGRWLAYVTVEWGREQVYVRPFPNTSNARWRVSNAGGSSPVWSRSGRELIFADSTNQIVSVAVAPGPAFSFSGIFTPFRDRKPRDAAVSPGFRRSVSDEQELHLSGRPQRSRPAQSFRRPDPQLAGRAHLSPTGQISMSTILITGCSKGIGYETALAFARAGHEVAATMRNPGRAAQLAEQAAREKLPITVIAMDVDKDASVTRGVATVTKALGPVDVLVNNAGIEHNGTVEEMPLAEFRAVMETNYFGALRCIQAVVPGMRQRRRGCIINNTSVAGQIACTPLAPYTASKFALEALSEALAAGSQSVRHPGRHCPTRHHRHADGSPCRHRRRAVALSRAAALRGVFHGCPGSTGLPVDRGGQGGRDRRQLHATAPASRGGQRRAISRVAAGHER